MRGRRLYPWLITLLLAGCAPVPITTSVADVDPLRRAVVEDVVLGISDVVASSTTTLVPARAAAGAFDSALLAALRAKGYTVSSVGGRGTAFDCVVDSLGGGLYRVNVRVGTSTMSRLWMNAGGGVSTGGAWTRRE
jgi:hypothetical protein